MTGLDDLPPDQRAALSLLLRQRKSYGEVAELLGISQRAVQERAHAALDSLVNGAGAGPGRDELSATQRAAIGDYLLGQQPGVAERLRTRTQLDSSPSARLWASTLASALAPLASTPLPEIPTTAPAAGAGEQGAADAPGQQPRGVSADSERSHPPGAGPSGAPAPGAGRPLPSSRLGGALLLTAIIAGVIIAVVLSAGEGGGSRGSHSNTTPAVATPSASSTSGTSSSSTSASTPSTTPSTTSTGPSEQARIPLTSPEPASKTIGVAVILAEGGQHAFYLAAEHVPPSKGFFYAVWLYNSPSSFQALGKSPPVGANGRMQGGALLPTNAAGFSKLIVTRETSTRPAHPGPIILSGTLKLGH